MFSLENLEYEWQALENGFEEFKKELEFHNQNIEMLTENDRFIREATNFTNEHSLEVEELKNTFSIMRDEVKIFQQKIYRK